MKQGEKIRVKIEDIAAGGESVARHDGMAIFIEGGVPGDEAEIVVDVLKSNYSKAKIINIIKPSADRIAPPCKIFHLCGACQMQQMSYPAQLRTKTKIVNDAMRKIGGVSPDIVKDAVGMDEPWGYRNKVQYPIRKIQNKFQSPNSKSQRFSMGYYRKGTHEVVDVDECLVLHPFLNTLTQAVRRAVAETGINIYDEDSGKGVLRNMLARISFAEGRALLCLVINEKELKPAKYFVERLQEALTHANNKFELVGILKNVNTRKTNVILGESTKQLWGRDYLHEKIGGLELELSIDSFFQINPIQTQRLYDIALELAAPTRNDLVIDAYCGIGSIALWVAPHAKEVYGIEENRSAVKDAEANAQRNRIKNAYFTCGRVEDVFEDYIDAGLRPDIIILDPPRSGCDKRVIESAIKFSPKKIVYVSCDPATLARDLKLLSSAYNVESVQPVDMFPQTSHIECVAKLTKLLSTQPFQTF